MKGAIVVYVLIRALELNREERRCGDSGHKLSVSGVFLGLRPPPETPRKQLCSLQYAVGAVIIERQSAAVASCGRENPRRPQ